MISKVINCGGSAHNYNFQYWAATQEKWGIKNERPTAAYSNTKGVNAFHKGFTPYSYTCMEKELNFMKKIYLLLSLLLLCCLSGGCGREELSTGYYEILSERQDFYDVSADTAGMYSNFLGMQFYQDEAAQLWAIADPLDREKADIYLYRTGGDRERIMKGLRGDFLSSTYRGFLDRDGNLYCFRRLDQKFVVIKTNSEGKQLYWHEEDKDIILDDICQLADGRIFLAYQSAGSGIVTPAELDADTGSISEAATFKYDASLHMGMGDSGLLCLNSENIYRIDVDSGTRESIWTFCGTSYVFPELSSSGTLKLWDFSMGEDGCPKLLWGGRRGKESFVETLQKVEAGADRELIVVRGLYFSTWLLNMTSLFNQTNSDYYVALETCGSEGDMDGYTMQASIEVAAGKGPDIFVGNLLGEYAYGIAQKGGFADLAPYLESSGIDENNYFPSTFGRWRQGTEIYSILPTISPSSYYMDGDVLGGNLEPDIETLVDALLSLQEEAVYMEGMDSLGVLEMLLQGSEDIWDAVEWNSGTCDFGSSLFARILETAKRYGDDSIHNYPGLLRREYYNLYLYKDRAVREEEGLAEVGILFDDGCYPQIYPYHAEPLSVNANST